MTLFGFLCLLLFNDFWAKKSLPALLKERAGFFGVFLFVSGFAYQQEGCY